ncbi:GxxExxY protein [Phycisphaera mikurensis]|uniref:GxxExxY protein n=1 Tax=Phycisphaera mikurensis (strain NBRC 102666 / KCTC 22515 / FYK2301M01) TaxID=1142394 RepID=I0IIF6_PHYMF|nr:GxxExxY protein [Phycisphaera mikurensis]MBB6442392.1 GxxExxY protein [Phycisphaera mikurensis]BAM05044.1 hypothetical protein PSMK_28850 [Phycisphaera mikurensis NBRC 102666]
MSDSELTGRVLGAAMEVHSALGAGFREQTYENALAVELGSRGISFERQVSVRLVYKDVVVGEGKVDLLVEGELVIELKAVERLHDAHRDQVITYLRAMQLPLGLLINFHGDNIRDHSRRVIADQA